MPPASQSAGSACSKAMKDEPTRGVSAMPNTPRVAEVKDTELGLERQSLKRKEVESSGGNRFKIVSQLVIAMKRFQASLNPTYTYGKRPNPSLSGPSCSAATSNRSARRSTTPVDTAEVDSVQSVARQNSRPGDKGATKAPRARMQHGHKTDYLFGSLPPHPREQEAAGRPLAVPKSESGCSLPASAS